MGTVILIYLIAGALYLLILYRLIKSNPASEVKNSRVTASDISKEIHCPKKSGYCTTRLVETMW